MSKSDVVFILNKCHFLNCKKILMTQINKLPAAIIFDLIIEHTLNENLRMYGD